MVGMDTIVLWILELSKLFVTLFYVTLFVLVLLNQN